MRRRHFLTVLSGASAVGFLRRASPAVAQTTDLSAPLRVRLFAGRSIRRVDVGGVAIDASAKTLTSDSGSKALGSDIVELTGSPYLDVSAITKAGDSVERRYPGTLFAQLRGDELLLINQVDVEAYVASVMSAEVSPGWATESLRAQAIAVRTYAAQSRSLRGAREYDLNDDTSSQVYPGVKGVAESFAGAAQDTEGRIIVAANAPASVFYGSSCGGHTASSMELTGHLAPPYLQGVPDLDPSGRAYCQRAPYFRWRNSVTVESMSRIVDVPAEQLTTISITQRWPDGRVKSISAAGLNFSVTLGGREFYQRALGILGYKVIPSAFFDVARDGASFMLVGHGVGHGVGMCQWGARGRADSGMSAAQILQAYFPGTTLSCI